MWWIFIMLVVGGAIFVLHYSQRFLAAYYWQTAVGCKRFGKSAVKLSKQAKAGKQQHAKQVSCKKKPKTLKVYFGFGVKNMCLLLKTISSPIWSLIDYFPLVFFNGCNCTIAHSRMSA